MRGADDESGALQAYLRGIAKLPRLTAEEEHELAVPHPARRRGGSPPAGRGQSPLRRQLRQAISRAGRPLPRPDPRRQSRTDGGGAPLRSGAERQVHHLRGLVGSAGDHARAVRSDPRFYVAAEAFGGRGAIRSRSQRTDRAAAALADVSRRSPTGSTSHKARRKRSCASATVTCRSAIRSRTARMRRSLARCSSRRPFPPAEDALIHRRLHARVRHALGELDGREREVLELRFGLDRDGDPRTLQEVGEMLRPHARTHPADRVPGERKGAQVEARRRARVRI